MRYKEFGIWQETTYEDFWLKSNYVSMALRFFGVESGESVAIQSENRPEWFFADIGTQSIGAVSVGLYPTNPSAEVKYLLSHSESKILFAEDQEQVDKALAVQENLPFNKVSNKSKSKFIVIPCNTAHYWYLDLKKKIKIPILNMKFILDW